MDETWIIQHGDKPGETGQMEMAAVLATLVDPKQTALRVEKAVEVRSDTARVVYLINPNCVVGEMDERTSLVRTGLVEDTLEANHPARDCVAGLVNAKAIEDWRKTGRPWRLVWSEDKQRTVYEPGAGDLVGAVATIGTHSLAKVAALGRLGMGLYNITGTREEPRYIVKRYSEGMLDEDGEPVVYDAAQLIMGEIQDELPLEHPWMLAYRARVNFEMLAAHVERETQLLIVTPDIIKRGAVYDPGGLHSYVAPDAPGHVWDAVEKHFFG